MKRGFAELTDFLKNKLGETLTKDMALILTGSRALGLEGKKSDYDCYLIFSKRDEEKVKKKFLKEEWMVKGGGIWTNFIGLDETQITLMTKNYDEIENEKEVALQFVWLNSIVLYNPINKFKQTLKKMQKNMDLETELRKTYISVLLDSSILRGMLAKDITKPCVFFKKGDIIRNFFKLNILIDKKPYPYEKVLYWSFSKSKNFKSSKKFISQIEKIDDREKATKVRKALVKHINEIMPKREYIGSNWWRFAPQ